MNTSVRPNTLAIDGCDAALLSHPAANDRDVVDDARISGERAIVATTRPPPPDLDAEGGTVDLQLDAFDEVTRPLPRTFASPSAWATRTALRIDRRPAIQPLPMPPAAPVEVLPPRDALPRPALERRRRVSDRGAAAWSSARVAPSPRSPGPPGALRERFIPWVAAFIGGLVLFAAQEVLAHVVAGP